MKEDHRPKDGFSADIRRIPQRADEDFQLTDEEIERALSRLQAAIESEGIREESWLWAATNEPTLAPNTSLSGTLPPVTPSAVTDDGAHQADSRVETPPGAAARALVTPADTSLELNETSEARRHKSNGTRPYRVSTRRRWKVGFKAAAAVAIVVVLASPLGGKAMAAAMQTFYFHQLVGVGQSDLNQIQQALQGAAGTNGVQSVDLKQYGSVDVSGGTGGYQDNLKIAAAQKLVGYPIKKLPGYSDQQGGINYMPGNEVTFHLNIGAINGLVQKLGGKTLFPSSVNGEPITVEIPAQVNEQVMGNGGKNMFLTEMKMPTVQVPGNVNMEQVKQALMDLPFLPGDIQQSLAKSSNWQDTLYVPSNGKATDLTINGYSAVLQVMPHGAERSIIWLENGVLYQLSGNAFATDTAIVAEAKELSR